MNIKEEFGPQLQKLIKNKHLSQNKIADKSGLSQAQVSRILKGENIPSINFLREVCLLTSIAPTKLIFDEEEQKKLFEQEFLDDSSPSQINNKTQFTYGDATIEMLVEYLRCRLAKESAKMNEEERATTAEKLHDCLRYLETASRRKAG